MRKIISLFLILFSASAFAGWPSSGTPTCLTAGSASIGCINYNGTTQAAGQFDSGAVAPVHTNRLNYDGYLFTQGLTTSGSLAVGGNIATAGLYGTFATITGQVQSNSKNVLTVLDTQVGQAPVAITVTASPFSYTATYGGAVAVSGGTVQNTTVTRNSTVVWTGTGSAADGIIPVRAGDIVAVTYTSTPTMYQLSN